MIYGLQGNMVFEKANKATNLKETNKSLTTVRTDYIAL